MLRGHVPHRVGAVDLLRRGQGVEDAHASAHRKQRFPRRVPTAGEQIVRAERALQVPHMPSFEAC